MADMGRISIVLPSGWIAYKDILTGFHTLSYQEDTMNILIDKSNEKDILKSLENIGKHFKINLALSTTMEYRTDKYVGLTAECKITGSTLLGLAMVLNINSNFIMFLGYTYKDYYIKLIEDIEAIVYSIKPNSTESGYINLDKLGNYKIKLLSGWSYSFVDKAYLLKSDDEKLIIKVMLSDESDMESAFISIPDVYKFKKFAVSTKEERTSDVKTVLYFEATAILNYQEIGIIGNIVNLNNNDIITIIGYVDIYSFYNDVKVIKELQRIISTLSLS